MEKLHQYIDQIRDLISKNNIKQAIAEIQQLLKGSPAFDEIILQSSRYNEVMKSIRMGKVSHEISSVELRKIDYALIDMLRELEDNYATNSALQSEVNDFWKKEEQTTKSGNNISITGDNNTVFQDIKGSNINVNKK